MAKAVGKILTFFLYAKTFVYVDWIRGVSLGGGMARHNREGRGADQQGFAYSVNYQPDWLRLVKVTRTLDSGRQSTKTLFRNPADHREALPGERIRTRLLSADQELDLEVSIGDPFHHVRRVQVTCVVPTGDGGSEEVIFTLEDDLSRPGDRSG